MFTCGSNFIVESSLSDQDSDKIGKLCADLLPPSRPINQKGYTHCTLWCLKNAPSPPLINFWKYLTK